MDREQASCGKAIQPARAELPRSPRAGDQVRSENDRQDSGAAQSRSILLPGLVDEESPPGDPSGQAEDSHTPPIGHYTGFRGGVVPGIWGGDGLAAEGGATPEGDAAGGLVVGACGVPREISSEEEPEPATEAALPRDRLDDRLLSSPCDRDEVDRPGGPAEGPGTTGPPACGDVPGGGGVPGGARPGTASVRFADEAHNLGRGAVSRDGSRLAHRPSAAGSTAGPRAMARIDVEWENEIAKNILSLYQTKLKDELDKKRGADQGEDTSQVREEEEEERGARHIPRRAPPDS